MFVVFLILLSSSVVAVFAFAFVLVVVIVFVVVFVVVVDVVVADAFCQMRSMVGEASIHVVVRGMHKISLSGMGAAQMAR